MPPTVSPPSEDASQKSTASSIAGLVYDSFADKLMLVRYGISGGTGVGANAVTLYVATEFFGVWYLLSAVIAYIVGLVISFTLQKLWTFRKRSGSTRLQFTTYTVLSIVNLVLNLLLLYVAVELLGLWYFGSQLCILAFIAFLSFLFNRNFTFKHL